MGEKATSIGQYCDAAGEGSVAVVQTTFKVCRAAIDFNLDVSQTGTYQWSTYHARSAKGIRRATEIVEKLEPELGGVTIEDVAEISVDRFDPTRIE
jgi:hypothetical protein